MKKAILYINQFFGQIGGEEKADFEPEIREGLIGPAMAMQEYLKDIKITHTIICGDNFMGSYRDEAVKRILEFLADKDFDIFLAGPAFRAGRYGIACGTICKEVQEHFNVPTVTSMNDENPGVEMFSKDVYIFKGGKSAAQMKTDCETMANFAVKLVNNAPLNPAAEEGYFGRGKRHEIFPEGMAPAADRVVDILLKKLNNQPYTTEMPIPKMERIPIAPKIKNLSQAVIAFVTSGGIVPVDNPDHIQSASATRWGRYNIANMERLEPGVFKTIHAGYDPAAANADPNRVLPLDALRSYEKEGKIGKIHEYFYTTVGTGTTQGEASRMAQEIKEYLLKAQVDGVILTST